MSLEYGTVIRKRNKEIVSHTRRPRYIHIYTIISYLLHAQKSKLSKFQDADVTDVKCKLPVSQCAVNRFHFMQTGTTISLITCIWSYEFYCFYLSHIAYSMGQIIKPVCVCLSVCVSVRLRALSRSHFLIDFHQNWHRRKYPQKEERVR